MKRSETIQIIALLAGNYDSIAKKDEQQKQLMVNTWQDLLGDLDYKLVLQAVRKTIIESSYPPTIHDIRKNAVEIVNPTTKRTGIEAWDEAYKMICNGNYMTEEQFKMASPEVRKFFGSVNQLKAYSRNADFNMDVVRSNFLKQYDTIVDREKEKKLLPQQMQDFTKQLAERMSIKQIGE